MTDGSTESEPADAGDPALAAMGATGTPVRVEPDAAVVSVRTPVPPDLHDEATPTFRPVAAARAVGGRLRRLVGHDDRSDAGRSD
ncbi:hypothetical protein [Halobaculum gomorrense]|uniref:Uncharacterized protein n=1 Tax=Halobaculum gomorrense TaxID=43928 RepID=A0A1M5MR24_9EURY|nr:hypothetical protein [Halobaculum gomorrense]SHG79349.1 hypothetical protein SAMN05443636_1096 [Halobaculum gomorrense]